MKRSRDGVPKPKKTVSFKEGFEEIPPSVYTKRDLPAHDTTSSTPCTTLRRIQLSTPSLTPVPFSSSQRSAASTSTPTSSSALASSPTTTRNTNRQPATAATPQNASLQVQEPGKGIQKKKKAAYSSGPSGAAAAAGGALASSSSSSCAIHRPFVHSSSSLQEHSQTKKPSCRINGELVSLDFIHRQSSLLTASAAATSPTRSHKPLLPPPPLFSTSISASQPSPYSRAANSRSPRSIPIPHSPFSQQQQPPQRQPSSTSSVSSALPKEQNEQESTAASFQEEDGPSPSPPPSPPSSSPSCSSCSPSPTAIKKTVTEPPFPLCSPNPSDLSATTKTTHTSASVPPSSALSEVPVVLPLVHYDDAHETKKTVMNQKLRPQQGAHRPTASKTHHKKKSASDSILSSALLNSSSFVGSSSPSLMRSLRARFVGESKEPLPLFQRSKDIMKRSRTDEVDEEEDIASFSDDEEQQSRKRRSKRRTKTEREGKKKRSSRHRTTSRHEHSELREKKEHKEKEEPITAQSQRVEKLRRDARETDSLSNITTQGKKGGRRRELETSERVQPPHGSTLVVNAEQKPQQEQPKQVQETEQQNLEQETAQQQQVQEQDTMQAHQAKQREQQHPHQHHQRRGPRKERAKERQQPQKLQRIQEQEAEQQEQQQQRTEAQEKAQELQREEHRKRKRRKVATDIASDTSLQKPTDHLRHPHQQPQPPLQQHFPSSSRIGTTEAAFEATVVPETPPSPSSPSTLPVSNHVTIAHQAPQQHPSLSSSTQPQQIETSSLVMQLQAQLRHKDQCLRHVEAQNARLRLRVKQLMDYLTRFQDQFTS
ncbi:hypothetical protein QOT17_021620 [Balamuthia mandrillaris]